MEEREGREGRGLGTGVKMGERTRGRETKSLCNGDGNGWLDVGMEMRSDDRDLTGSRGRRNLQGGGKAGMGASAEE